MPAILWRVAILATAVIVASGGRAAGGELPSPLALTDVLEAARSRNPNLRERRRLFDAAALRPRAAGWPEDPMLMLEWWQQPLDFSAVPLMLSLKQPIPYASKLRLRRELSEREALVSRTQVDEVAIRLSSDVKRAYFDLALAERSLGVLEKVRVILENLVRVTDARYRVGKTVQADLFKAQNDLLMIENEKLDVERQRDEAIARLNGLLDRPSHTPLGPTSTPPTMDAILPPFEVLVDRAVSLRPEVVRAARALSVAGTQLELARRENWPELAGWLAYMADFRGVNTFTVGFSSSLPVFSTIRKRALTRAAQAELDAAKAAYDAVRRRADVEVRAALLGLETAARHARLHADRLIPLAELTLDSALASYQADRIDFPAVLEAARAVRDHHLNHIKFLSEYERRLADLEQAVGEELDRKGDRP